MATLCIVIKSVKILPSLVGRKQRTAARLPHVWPLVSLPSEFASGNAPCKFAAINETLHRVDLAQTWSTPSAPPPLPTSSPPPSFTVTRAFSFEEAPLGPCYTARAGRTPLADMS